MGSGQIPAVSRRKRVRCEIPSTDATSEVRRFSDLRTFLRVDIVLNLATLSIGYPTLAAMCDKLISSQPVNAAVAAMAGRILERVRKLDTLDAATRN